jgi:hypothetical protein
LSQDHSTELARKPETTSDNVEAGVLAADSALQPLQFLQRHPRIHLARVASAGVEGFGRSSPRQSVTLNRELTRCDQDLRVGEIVVADRIALRKIGLGFFAITASVILITVVVIKSHIDARLSIEVGGRVNMASVPIADR